MKNITTIAKITAKITTTALLFFLALFTLTTNLKAQAVQDNSKSGFFAGFVYLQGFQVDTSKSISGSTVTTSYEVTGTSDTTRIEVTYLNENLTNTAIREGISALFSANCETGAASVESSGTYRFNTDSFESFDPGRKPTLEQLVSSENDATVTFNHIYQLDDGTMTTDHFRTGSENAHTSHCFRHFYGDLSSDRTAFVFDDYSVIADSSVQVAASSSTESDKLSGIGLQFGYRWEKWRASFTHYTGQGGDNELTNSLVIADYFFQEKFFVGAGLASMQLTNSSAGSSISASATSPVLQVGYTENLTKNLQLSIGVLQYSSGLSLSSTTATTTTPTITYLTEKQTATNVGDSATLGSTGSFIAIPGGSTISLGYDSFGGENGDRRIEVTQVGERTVNIQKTVTPAGGGGGGATIEAELKAPTVISISFHLSF